MSNSSGIVSSVGPGAAALKGVLKLAEVIEYLRWEMFNCELLRDVSSD